MNIRLLIVFSIELFKNFTYVIEWKKKLYSVRTPNEYSSLHTTYNKKSLGRSWDRPSHCFSHNQECTQEVQRTDYSKFCHGENWKVSNKKQKHSRGIGG